MRSLKEMRSFTDALDERHYSQKTPQEQREMSAAMKAVKAAGRPTPEILKQAREAACTIWEGWGRIPGEAEALCVSNKARVVMSFWPHVKEAEVVARRIEREASRPTLKAKTIRLLLATAYCPTERQIRMMLRADPTCFSTTVNALHLQPGMYMVKAAVLCEDKGHKVGVFHIGNATEEDVRIMATIMRDVSLTELEGTMRTCAACGKTDGKLYACAGCYFAHYCDRDCQRAKWASSHKSLCMFCRQLTRIATTMSIPMPDETARRRATRVLTNQSADDKDAQMLTGAAAREWMRTHL
jgi:hypothetical protein